MIGRLEVSIALSYLRTRKRQTILSMLGVAMGVGFFITVNSMMQGFQEYFISKIVDVAPHVLMKDEFREPPRQAASLRWPGAEIEYRGIKPREELRGIRNGARIVQDLQRIPGITVAPVLRGQAFLRYGGKDVSASIIGIDPEAEKRVSTLEKDLVQGSLDALLTNSNGIILGAGLAKNAGARLGSKLTVVSPQGVIMIMKVVGISRTGITTMDYSEAYVLLKKAQILEKRDNRINLIKMKLADINRSNALAAELEARYGWRTEGWEETNENVFGLFKVQNLIMYSVVGAILIVAGFGIFNIITTVVNEKVKDIAILKSMGFGRGDVERIFILQGLIVGLAGTLVGWVLGWLMMQGLSTVPLDLGDRGIIVTSHVPLHRTPWHYIYAAAFAIFSATLSSLLPARKAAGLKPVDIIRGAA